jgi:hypothetical protein
VSTQAKVAAVISAWEVVLNVGRSDGVKADDIATVFRAIEIKDPDTGNVIGTVRRPRLRLRVREVQDKLCVAQTYEMVAPEASTISTIFQSVALPPLRQRITFDQKEVDYRTVLVSVGDVVEIREAERPAPEKK